MRLIRGDDAEPSRGAGNYSLRRILHTSEDEARYTALGLAPEARKAMSPRVIHPELTKADCAARRFLEKAMEKTFLKTKAIAKRC